MPYAFSLPTKSDKVPAGDDWIHEVKYDGYRMMVVRDQVVCGSSVVAAVTGPIAFR
jgi:ATP-dependent DNA ligase